CAQMVPKVETRIDLEQKEPAVGGSFEIELGDAAKIELARNRTSQRYHVLGVGDFYRGAGPIAFRVGAYLPSGELRSDGAVMVDVHVIALDAGFRSRDQLLEEKIHAHGNEARPEPPQHLRAVYAQHLTAATDRLPRFASDRRLDDDGKADAGIGRSRTGRANPARGRPRQAQPLRKRVKPCLVDQIFDQPRAGDHEPKSLRQLLAMSGYEQQLRVGDIEQDGRLRLC